MELLTGLCLTIPIVKEKQIFFLDLLLKNIDK